MISRCGHIAILLLLATCVVAQRPKLDIKAYVGYNTHVFVYKEYEKSKDVLHGWQGGFGFRVSYRRVMGEINFNFLRNTTIVAIPDSLQPELEFDKFEFRFNSFHLPLKVGWIPVKTPPFKWYLYTGINFRMNTKGKLKIADEEISFKPKEAGLANPNIDWIVGTQIDLYGFNVELMYSLGVTNSIRENIRTNSHKIILNFGVHF